MNLKTKDRVLLFETGETIRKTGLEEERGFSFDILSLCGVRFVQGDLSRRLLDVRSSKKDTWAGKCIWQAPAQSGTESCGVSPGHQMQKRKDPGAQPCSTGMPMSEARSPQGTQNTANTGCWEPSKNTLQGKEMACSVG